MGTLAANIIAPAHLSIDEAAKWFCAIDSIAMANFLQAIALRVKTFNGDPNNQWCVTMGHVLGAQGSDPMPEAAEMIRSWAFFLQPDEPAQ